MPAVFLTAVLGVAASLPTPSAVAATTTLVHSFGSIADGTQPYTQMVQMPDGAIYGTTVHGGVLNQGTIFKITPGGQFQTVYSFGQYSGDGDGPFGSLLLGPDGNIYGVTGIGGTHGAGTVFKYTPSGVESVVYNFGSVPNDGRNPFGGLTYNPADGNLYGTTFMGGLTGSGTVYKVSLAGSEKVIKSLSTSLGGPLATLCLNPADGLLYGTANFFNNTLTGAVFKISTSGVLTFVKGLTGDTGYFPSYSGLVLAADGNMYGTTTSGAQNTGGSIFKVSSTGVFSKVYDFEGTVGFYPESTMIQGTDGAFYGTCKNGPGGYGSVYKFVPGANPAAKAIYVFTGTGDGAAPGALMQASNGLLYGAARAGGEQGLGSIFNLTTSGSLFTIQDLNTSFHDGTFPDGRLLLGKDGNWYGTTSRGGRYNNGTIYQITSAGDYNILYSFKENELVGSNPVGGLIQTPDGTFYGAAGFGGSVNSYGSVYKFTLSGNAQTVTPVRVYAFDNIHGSDPGAGLILGSDGNIYGTTLGGGSNNFGTIFKLTTAGVITTLRSFVVSNGRTPMAALVQGPDGGLYGTTSTGGLGYGVVYKITTTGAGVWTKAITAAQGYIPQSDLVFGADGNLYGTASAGAANGAGGIFKVTPSGTITTAFSFDGTNLSGAYAPLLLAPDNKLYGADYAGHEFSFDGSSVDILGMLNPTFGTNITSGFALGLDGKFYGLTSQDGANFARGTAFRLDAGIPAATILVVSAPATATAGAPFNVTVTAQDQFGNTFPGYTGTVHFTSNDPNAVLPADATLTNGVGTFSTTLKFAGYITIRARDTATSSITGTTHVTVSSDVANHLTISAPSTMTAGSGYYVVVSAKDQYENVVKGYTGTIHFTSTDPLAVLPADLVLTGGAKQLPVKLKTPGTQTITVTDTADAGLTVTTGAITVN